MIPDLAATFVARPVVEWVSSLEAAGVPVGPINTADQAFGTPGLLSPSLLETLPHPTAGAVRVVGTPIRLSDAPVVARSAPPTLGQHTDEVPRDWLGMTNARIDRLREDAVI